MSMRCNRWRWHHLVLAAVMIPASCETDPLSPFKPEVANTPDSLQFRVTGLADLSGTAAYEWQNTGTAASVEQTASLSAGEGQLLIRDAQGDEVYRRSLADAGVFQTRHGVAGRWVISADFAGASGTATFRVQRR